MACPHAANEPQLFDYSAFGLQISANRSLPGLTRSPRPGEPDLRVWLDDVPADFRTANGKASDPYISGEEANQASEDWVTVWKYRGYFRLRYTDQTEFFVDPAGTQVWATWPDELTLADTATYLLGPVMNIVLRLRGTIALHGSVVRIGDVAVAFVGSEGAGKSTTAATFALAGYPVLTDDIAAVDDRGESFWIIPAYPRIRLWPRSVELLLGSSEALPRLTSGWEKRYLELEGDAHRFEPEAVPLAAIYFLHPRGGDATACTIHAEPERDAMVKLIGNTHANYLFDQVGAAASFNLLQRVVRLIPLRGIVPGSGAAALAQLRDAVVDDLRRLQELPA
jgi:hypothetical protein